MVWETAVMSFAAVLLLLLAKVRKTRRPLLGALAGLCAVVSMVLFILMQRISGNPDAGQEIPQMYLPCGIYLALALWGFSTAFRRKVPDFGKEG